MRRTVVAAAIVLASSAGFAEGRKYALLIGVGSYTYIPSAALEGPPHDVKALQSLLTEKWGFAPQDVQVLLNGEATKAAILGAVDRLVVSTKPSDFVFLYFSGHGTSGYDRVFKDVGIDNNSGALIPADFRPGPLARLKEGLIIGSRDLKPRLERIDKDRKVFVVFDSCFSGNSARSVFAVGQARYVPATELVEAGARALVHTAAEDEGPATPGPPEAPQAPYPYSNLIYISAASKSEKAMDITSVALRGGRVKTVDDQPHGALTNALLEGLSGAADTNRDGKITYGELFQFAKDRVTQSFPHQPQLLAPTTARDEVLNAPVLGSAPRGVGPLTVNVGRKSGSAASPSLAVKTVEVAPDVVQKIGATAGVTLATGPGAYDLLITQGPLGFKLYHASGDEIASYQAGEAAALVERVARQVAVRELIDLSYPDQDFNVTVDIPGNRGFLRQGDQFVIDFSAEKDSHVLLFDVDSGGTVSVLYPFNKGEAGAVRKGRVPQPPDSLRVSPPYGMEYLKVVAFVEKPAAFDRWIGASFSPRQGELDELLKMLKAAHGRKALSRLKVVTRGSGS